MNKKWCDLAFVICFMLMITVPLLFLNTNPEAQSQQENRMLTRWPGLGFNGEINAWYGHYFEDRIGFREQAVRAYTAWNYYVFGEFAEKLHMFGKEGYVFPADEGYIGAYQNLRTDEKLISDFTVYLKNTNDYCKQKNIPFVFVAGLDKKTVYPEFMPDSIHVHPQNLSIMKSLAGHLEQSGVPYVIPVEEYMQAKQTRQIYNKMYDCAHWNELGEMIAIRLADEKLADQGLDVMPVREEDFDLVYEKRDRLEFAGTAIDEMVPVYQPKQNGKVKYDAKMSESVWHIDGTNVLCYRNKNAQSSKKILIFNDSFLNYSKHFYCGRYRQVYLVSRQNYEALQYYVNLLRPDAVIYENAERAFVDDLYAYTHLSDVQYEPAYESVGKLSKGTASLTLQVTKLKHASSDGVVSNGQPMQLAVDQTQPLFAVQGEILLPEEFDMDKGKYHLYAKYKKQYYEISYSSFREEQPGIWENSETVGAAVPFYLEMKTAKSGKIQILLVDEKSQMEYRAGIFELTER